MEAFNGTWQLHQLFFTAFCETPSNAAGVDAEDGANVVNGLLDLLSLLEEELKEPAKA